MSLDLNRRDMLKAAAGAALLVPQRVLGANDRVRVAVWDCAAAGSII